MAKDGISQDGSVSPIVDQIHEGPSDQSQGLFTDWAKDFVILTLQQFFTHRSDYRFSKEDSETEIMITDKYTVNKESVEKRPAIVVDRGTIRPRYVGIDQMSAHNQTDGSVTYTDLFDVDLTCRCWSRQGLEAETIANLVFGALMFFRRALRKKGIHDIRPLAIGAEQSLKVDSDTDIQVVDVPLTMRYQYTWTLIPRADLLEDLRLC